MKVARRVLMLIALSAATAYAQQTAQVNGVVRDEAGAVMPAVKVTLRNLGTGLIRATITSGSGAYVITSVPAGQYELSADTQGFSRYSRTGLTLTVGQAATIDIVMKVAGVVEEVTVSAEAPLIETTKASLSRIVDQRQVEELPIIGRNFVDFVLLSSNVAVGRSQAQAGGIFQEPDVGVGSAAVSRLTFGGQKEDQNLILVDGADNSQTITGLQRAAPSQEAVREFRVLSSTYTSDLGRSLGGFVNIITKSGTNDYHGNVYYFGMNDDLNAVSLLKQRANDLRQNQFGFTAGGPLIKDRAFFFANYEGQRRAESNEFGRVVLDNLDAINAARGGLGLPPEVDDLLLINDYNEFLTRGDLAITPNHQASVRYNFISSKALNFLGAAGREAAASSTARNNFLADQSLVASVTSILSPQWVNEARFQFARRSFNFPAISKQPDLEVSNLIVMGKDIGNLDFYRQSRLQWSDTLTHMRGSHTIQFGFDINYLKNTTRQTWWAPGRIIFSSLDAFLGRGAFRRPTPFFFAWLGPTQGPTPDVGTSYTNAISPALAPQTFFRMNETFFSFFGQDQWKITPDLTFNYGVRWEFETIPHKFIDGDFNNWDPRIGLAYRLSDKASIRAGFGIFHSRIFNTLAPPTLTELFGLVGDTSLRALGSVQPFDPQLATKVILAPPRFAVLDLIQNGRFPNVAAPYIGFGLERNIRTPYTVETSLALSYSPFHDIVLSAEYLYVQGQKIPSVSGNANAFQTGTRPSGKPILAGRFDSNFLTFLLLGNRGTSNYNGATFKLSKRFSHNFGLNASYTVSKTIDNVGSAKSLPDSSENNDLKLDRALSKQHIGQRLTITFTGDAPKRYFLTRDFKLSTITSLQSGRRFTLFVGGDANEDVNPLNDRPGQLGRDTFEGDSFVSFDMRVARDVHFSERFRGEVIIEFTNLFNTLNIKDYSTVFGSDDLSQPPAAGFLAPKSVFPARQVQYAFKLHF